MSSILKGVRLSLALVGAIAVLIEIPALLWGASARWQALVLSLFYVAFFLGTVWRVIKHGDLIKRSEDEQLKRRSGRIAVIVQIIGLLSVHWLALYDFSRQNKEMTASSIGWAIVSFLLLFVAIVVSQLAIRTLGKFFDRLTIKSDHQLVDTGIYRFVRHPIYLGYILLFAGFCTMLQSFVSLGLLAAVCTIWFGNRIAIEEEMLVNQFGSEYQAYQQKTKKLVPFVY